MTTMKQFKMSCPSIIGTTYSTFGLTYPQIIEELKAGGLMPAAWAMEELVESNVSLFWEMEGSIDVEAVDSIRDELTETARGLDTVADSLRDSVSDLYELMEEHSEDADGTLYLSLASLHTSLEDALDLLSDPVRLVDGVLGTIGS